MRPFTRLNARTAAIKRPGFCHFGPPPQRGTDSLEHRRDRRSWRPHFSSSSQEKNPSARTTGFDSVGSSERETLTPKLLRRLTSARVIHLGTNLVFQGISSDQLDRLRADGPDRKRDIGMSRCQSQRIREWYVRGSLSTGNWDNVVAEWP
jgi:hypothetical protein